MERLADRDFRALSDTEAITQYKDLGGGNSWLQHLAYVSPTHLICVVDMNKYS
jgi:hypothetical protein